MNIKLKNEELAILKACSLEPGTLINIANEAEIEQNLARAILNRLKKLNLVYSQGGGELEIWSSTAEGAGFSSQK